MPPVLSAPAFVLVHLLIHRMRLLQVGHVIDEHIVDRSGLGENERLYIRSPDIGLDKCPFKLRVDVALCRIAFRVFTQPTVVAIRPMQRLSGIANIMTKPTGRSQAYSVLVGGYSGDKSKGCISYAVQDRKRLEAVPGAYRKERAGQTRLCGRRWKKKSSRKADTNFEPMTRDLCRR